jgi:hypothetical protein
MILIKLIFVHYLQVGFVDHATQSTFELPISRTLDVASALLETNVGVPGNWIYRIDRDLEGN